MKTYEWIARKVVAINNCRAAGLDDWRERHTETLEAFVRHGAPWGGTRLNLERSNARRLEFKTVTEHTVTVRPSLALGFELTVSGRDRQSIKDYIADVFHAWLNSPGPTGV